MTAPLKVTEILVHTGGSKRPPGSIGKVWEDQSGVAQQRDHWIVLIDRALADVTAGMRMNVGENTKSALSTEVPQRRVPHGVKGDSAAFIRIWIKIVVTDEGGHPVCIIVLGGQQKRSAFVATLSPPAQFKD